MVYAQLCVADSWNRVIPYSDNTQRALQEYFTANGVDLKEIHFPVGDDVHELPFSFKPKRVRTPAITLNSLGDFHHRTYFLLNGLRRPVAYVHIDAHPDSNDWQENMVRYNNFVHHLQQNTHITEMHFFGLTPSHILTWFSWLTGDEWPVPYMPQEQSPKFRVHLAQRIADWQKEYRKRKDSMFKDDNIKFILDHESMFLHEEAFTGGDVENPDVYISIDLDAIPDFPTAYMHEGVMTLERIMAVIEKIGREHHIIGADIVGLDASRANGNLTTALDQIHLLYTVLHEHMVKPERPIPKPAVASHSSHQ